jgi:hypothetical protein
MIFDAAKRSIDADPAVYALVVDAKDEAAARFYRHKNFLPLDRAAMPFFLPLATLRKALAP